MLEVADYRDDGRKLVVRLKCSCGGRRILKGREGGAEVFSCAKCGAKIPLDSLKNDASGIWGDLIWEVIAEESPLATGSLRTYFPAACQARTTRYGLPYCTLHGHVVELTRTGLLFRARDFQAAFGKGMGSTHRFATVQFEPPVPDLPPRIYGQIADIAAREEDLPLAQLRIDFPDAAAPEVAKIIDFLSAQPGVPRP